MARLGRLLALVAALFCGGVAMAADRENTIYLDVPGGRVVIAMRPDLAPATCARIKALVRRCDLAAVAVVVVARGDGDAGAVLLKLSSRDAGCVVLAQVRRPQGIRHGHLSDERADRRIDRGTALRLPFRTPRPSAAKPVATPAHGVRLNEH